MTELALEKFTLIVLTRCNLRCRLCCEYIPQNRPFPDMTMDECRAILAALFATVDRVTTLHLSGGGEPFLHHQLPAMIAACFDYADKFDRLMLFTNSTILPDAALLAAINNYRAKTIVQLSRYGINPEREEAVTRALEQTGARLKIEKYYGEQQAFDGWVDFGSWDKYARTPAELATIFHNCAVTRDMRGNWRTRDGRAHWCSRSQRGMELGLIPDEPRDYVDLLDRRETPAQKQEKLTRIMSAPCLSACAYCSGHQGTADVSKRFAAAEQLREAAYA